MKKKLPFLAILFITNFIIISVSFSSPVYADVPEVINVEPLIRDNQTILNITIEHEYPMTDHYVDLVQIDVDGTINDLNLTKQSTTYFTVEYNLGEISDDLTVRVRANCTYHGWSDWSSVQTIPEFPSWITLPLLVIGTLTLVVARKKLKQINQTHQRP